MELAPFDLLKKCINASLKIGNDVNSIVEIENCNLKCQISSF